MSVNWETTRGPALLRRIEDPPRVLLRLSELDAFDSGNVSEVLDISRKSTVRKKLFGLF